MKKTIATLSMLTLLLLPSASLAVPGIDEPLIPSACTSGSTSVDACGIAELVQVALNVAQFMLGILGSVTLIVFIIGGFILLTAAGNAQQVDRGKKVFQGAIVGLAIIFTSWMLINLVVIALTDANIGESPKLFPGQGAEQSPLEINN